MLFKSFKRKTKNLKTRFLNKKFCFFWFGKDRPFPETCWGGSPSVKFCSNQVCTRTNGNIVRVRRRPDHSELLLGSHGRYVYVDVRCGYAFSRWKFSCWSWRRFTNLENACDDATTCSGHGVCKGTSIETLYCDCSSKWKGTHCDIEIGSLWYRDRFAVI